MERIEFFPVAMAGAMIGAAVGGLYGFPPLPSYLIACGCVGNAVAVYLVLRFLFEARKPSQPGIVKETSISDKRPELHKRHQKHIDQIKKQMEWENKS